MNPLLLRCALLASAFTLAIQGPASAATLELNYAKDYGDGVFVNASPCEDALYPHLGRGCYNKVTDDIYVKDSDRDGHSVGVHWITKDGREGLCIDSLGAPNWTRCKKIFSGSKRIQFRTGTCDRSDYSCTTPTYASGWRNWGGWSDWTAT